jgi:hypothetical protein
MLKEVTAISLPQFVTLRDHHWHDIPVLGGMWGGRGAPIPDIEQILSVYFVHRVCVPCRLEHIKILIVPI